MIQPNYVMKATVIRVIDGDTVCLSVSPAFNFYFHGYKFRLHGIDTPEKNSTDPDKRALAMKATEYVKNAIESKPILVQFIKTKGGADLIDSFGRYLAVIFYTENGEQRNLNDELLALGLATKWEG